MANANESAVTKQQTEELMAAIGQTLKVVCPVKTIKVDN